MWKLMMEREGLFTLSDSRYRLLQSSMLLKNTICQAKSTAQNMQYVVIWLGVAMLSWRVAVMQMAIYLQVCTSSLHELNC